MEGVKNTIDRRSERQNREELINRLKETGKGIVRAVSLVGLLVQAIPLIQKSTHGYDISQEVGKDGKRKWRHEDKETEEMVSYLAGLGPLPERVALLKSRDYIWTHYISSLTAHKPEGWESFTKEEIEQFWISKLTKEHLYNAPADFDVEDFVRKTTSDVFDESDSAYSRIFTFSEPNRIENGDGSMSIEDKEVLYEKLWQLMETCGAPKIRPVQEGRLSNRETGRANYDSSNHTLYIQFNNRQSLNDTYMAEMAHACQSNIKPFTKNNQKIADVISVAVYSTVTVSNFRDGYDNLLYDMEGSIEYEAHKEIEPKIKAFLDNKK